MSFKLDWHPASIAEQWPKGSVVLVRVKMKPEWSFSYFLKTDYDEFESYGEGAQYLLVEEPERKQ